MRTYFKSLVLHATFKSLVNHATGGLLFLLCAIAPLAGAPVVYYRGILNSASYSLQGLPNASIARGSIFTLFGSGMGPDGVAQQGSYPLSTAFAGVSIEVRQGTTRVAAIPLIVTPGQISALMPSNAPLGAVGIAVTFNNQTSNYSSAKVVPVSFGIFAVNQAGSGPGVVQNVNGETDRPVNSTRNPAKRGQTLIIWGTGLGAVPNDTVAPSAGDLSGQVEVFIGGKSAPAIYKGRSPCCSGVDQIVATVPENAPLGCYVPVQVRLNGSVTSNATTMAISDGAVSCSDAQSPAERLLMSGGSTGIFLAARYNIRDDLVSILPANFVTDEFTATFLKQPASDFAFHPLISLPPAGSCTVYSKNSGITFSGLFGLLVQFPGLGADLDAGASLAVGPATADRANVPVRYYSASLGTTGDPNPPSVLNPGNSVSVSGSGGADIGAFSAKFNAPPAFDFKERPSLVTVPRSSVLSLSWNPTGGTALIVGQNYNQPSNVTEAFVCTAAAGDGVFTVPSYVLQTLPPSLPILGQSNGYVMVGLVPDASTFTAPSLDAGYAIRLSGAVKTVLFQ